MPADTIIALLATTLLAWLSPAAVYLTVAAFGLLVAPLVASLGLRRRGGKEAM